MVGAPVEDAVAAKVVVDEAVVGIAAAIRSVAPPNAGAGERAARHVPACRSTSVEIYARIAGARKIQASHGLQNTFPLL